MCVKEGVSVLAANRSHIKSQGALNHGYTTIVVGDNIKDQVHIKILIYHLILVIGLPFKTNVIILLFHRHKADIIVNI